MPTTIYWWNMGKKTLDYNGTIAGYFKEKGIKISRITHPTQKDLKGYRVRVNVSGITTIDTFGTIREAAITGIRVFLTLMGDKSAFHVYSRTYTINH